MTILFFKSSIVHPLSVKFENKISALSLVSENLFYAWSSLGKLVILDYICGFNEVLVHLFVWIQLQPYLIYNYHMYCQNSKSVRLHQYLWYHLSYSVLVGVHLIYCNYHKHAELNFFNHYKLNQYPLLIRFEVC